MTAQWTLLGQVPHRQQWIAIDVHGMVILVSTSLVDDYPQGFRAAMRVPPSTRDHVRPIPVSLEELFAPTWEPVEPLVPTNKTIIERRLVDNRWLIRCGYDHMAGVWLVAGEVEDASN